MTIRLEFWLIFALPWLLDIVGGRAVLGSVFGATLWGIAVVVAYVHTNSKDERFRRRLNALLAVLSASWITYWVLCLKGPAPTYFESTTLRWLTLLHAGLLAAGAGMVFFLGLAALLWLRKDKVLKKSSWERRETQRLRPRLPSLESLGRLCSGSLKLAFLSWGAGLAIAFSSALVRWKRATLNSAASTQQASFAWLLDPGILLITFLWAFLILAQQLNRFFSPANPWLYRAYLLLSLLFLVSFGWFISGEHPFLREPISWFVR